MYILCLLTDLSNNFSGHGSMIGCKTQKVVGYDVMTKTCRICKSAEFYGREKKNMTAGKIGKEAPNQWNHPWP
jgi:hypothetical protein